MSLRAATSLQLSDTRQQYARLRQAVRLSSRSAFCAGSPGFFHVCCVRIRSFALCVCARSHKPCGVQFAAMVRRGGYDDGFVISEVERRKAEVIARGVCGVVVVENKLRVEGGEE